MTGTVSARWGFVDDSALNYMVDRISAGQCILFVGAGLAQTCEDDHGIKGPSATELARLVSTRFLGRNEVQDNLPLAADYSLAFDAKYDIDSFIRQKLSGLKPSPAALTIPQIPWKAIYTTNYDVVIEKAYETATNPRQLVQPIYGNLTPLSSLADGSIPLYKLHGCISRIDSPDSPLAITHDEMAKARDRRRRLFRRFSDDLSEYTVFYVGYSRTDTFFQDIIGDIIDECGGVDGFRRSFAIAPGAKEYEKLAWERNRKISLINTDAEEYLPWLVDSVSVHAESEQARDLSLEGALPEPPELARGDIKAIRDHYAFPLEEMQVGLADAEDFYKGNEAQWADIAAGHDSRRELAEEIILTLVGDVDATQLRTAVFFGEAGSGKSTLLKRIAADLLTDWTLPVVFVRNQRSLDYNVLRPLIQALGTRLYVGLDDVGERLRELETFIIAARRDKADITILGCARLNEWSYKNQSYGLTFDISFDLQYLTTPEIDALIQKLEIAGQLGILAQRTQTERRHAFIRRADRQLLVALREATEGKRFDQIIQDEYSAIPEEAAQEAYLLICCVYQAKVTMRAGVLRRLTGVSFEDFQAKILTPAERVIIEGKEDGEVVYRARHPIVAQIVADYKIPASVERLSIYRRIFESLDLGMTEDRLAYQRLSRSRELADSLMSYSLKAAFYKACRDANPSDAIAAQHWAIAAMDGRRFDTAQLQLNAARELDPRDRSIQHSWGMLALRQYEHRSGTSWEPIYFTNAQERFSELIRRRPKDSVSYVSLAALYTARARRVTDESGKVDWYSRALGVLEEGEQFTYEPSTMAAEKGRVYDELGQLEDADTAFRKALTDNPSNGSARYGYGRFLLRQERATELITILQEGLDIDSDDMKLRHLKGIALACADAPRDAVVTELKAAAGPNMRNWQAGLDLAVYLYIKGQELQADEVFSSLKEHELEDREKRRPRRLPQFCDLTTMSGNGRITTLMDTYGFIGRADHPLDMYLNRYSIDAMVDAELNYGSQVTFDIRFSLFGPVARSVRLAGANTWGRGSR